MATPAEPGPAANTSQEQLDSWKAIAAYLKRDVTTVQRWERREGMPVHRHIHAKRGSVYALTAELEEWRRGRASVLESSGREAAAAPEIPLLPEAPGDGAAPRSRGRRHLVLLAAAFAVIAVSAASYILYRGHSLNGARPQIASIAVLPLRNLSGDSAQDYLADGMTEALIGRLAAIHGLRVISYTSVIRFRVPQASIPEIGRTLGADAIVEGSVIRDGNRIRVTAQLIRAASDEHFWSQTYDRELRDVLGLESDLTQSIADRVEVTLTGEERHRLAATRSVAPEVYESYLKGRFALQQSADRAAVEASIADFESALRLDPTFAPAYLGEARAFSALGTVFVGDNPDQTRPKVISAANSAIELDPELADAHAVLANTEQELWHWAQAETEYRRALELSPSDADAHISFALWLLCQGRTDEALSWAHRGRQLDPLAVSGESLAWILFQARHFDEAVRELRSVLAVHPDNVGALITLGFVLSAGDHAAEAVPVLERAVAASNGSPAATGVLIRAYALSGRRQEALRLLDALQRRKAAGYVPAAAFVNAYLGLGAYDDCFAWLEQAYVERSNILQFLKVHPFFDPIRNDPRFRRLVSRVWGDAE